MPSKIMSMLTILLVVLMSTTATAAAHSVAADDGTQEARRLFLDDADDAWDSDSVDGICYDYKGCWKDSIRRILTLDRTENKSMTTKMCEEHCSAIDGAVFFGTQYSTHCFCGQASDDYKQYGDEFLGCHMPCGGDSEEQCGGNWTMDVYKYQ